MRGLSARNGPTARISPKTHVRRSSRSGAERPIAPANRQASRTSPLCCCCQVAVGVFCEVAAAGASFGGVRVSSPRLRDLGVLDRERVLASPGPSSRPSTAVASLPPPGRSSSLRSGRSTWTCGFAGGRVAATGECPVLPRDSARLDRGAEGMPAVALGRMVVAGPGVACPKSWRAGCELAALDAESFPGCPPGPVTEASAACRASAWRRAKMASLIRRLSDRSASLWVFPSASFFS